MSLIDASVVRATMYRHALAAVLMALKADFACVEPSLPKASSDFLRSIDREMTIANQGAGKRPGAERPAPLIARMPQRSPR